MLWTITIILVILWILGLVSGYTLSGWIHVLLVWRSLSLSSTCSPDDAASSGSSSSKSGLGVSATKRIKSHRL